MVHTNWKTAKLDIDIQALIRHIKIRSVALLLTHLKCGVMIIKLFKKYAGSIFLRMDI